jgi:hypothetical protein
VHVLKTPKHTFTQIGKSKDIWILLSILGSPIACLYYWISVNPKLRAAKNWPSYLVGDPWKIQNVLAATANSRSTGNFACIVALKRFRPSQPILPTQ